MNPVVKTILVALAVTVIGSGTVTVLTLSVGKNDNKTVRNGVDIKDTTDKREISSFDILGKAPGKSDIIVNFDEDFSCTSATDFGGTDKLNFGFDYYWAGANGDLFM